MIIEITWEVDDGYAGKSRPQRSVFNTKDYYDTDEEWIDLSEDEKEEQIDDFIQREFESRISWIKKRTKELKL